MRDVTATLRVCFIILFFGCSAAEEESAPRAASAQSPAFGSSTSVTPTPDGGCVPETTAEVCARLGKNCGSLFAQDRCGGGGLVSCGVCAAPDACGGAGVPNQCGHTCIPETDQVLCQKASRNCESLTVTD